MDDFQDEAAKLRLQERIDDAVSAALASQQKNDEKAEVCATTTFSWCLLICPMKQPRSSATEETDDRASRRSGRKR